MPLQVHQLIMTPGNRQKFICQDGLSPTDKIQIGKIYNFGGDLMFQNCGPQFEYAILNHAKWNMF